MLVFSKNGIDFITDLVWQKHDESNKVNLKQMKKQCEFNFYCKTTTLGTTYGFVKCDVNAMPKKPVALSLFVLESKDLIQESQDVFICFHYDADLYGYVFLYGNTVFPEKGEYIGDELTVKARIISMAREYGIKTVRICDDVPFYNSPHFEAEANVNVIPIIAYDKNGNKARSGASEYYLWRKHASYKSRVSKASIKPVSIIKPRHYISICLLLVLLGMFFYLKYRHLGSNYVYHAHNLIVQHIDSKTFIHKCFDGVDDYIKPIDGWSFVRLSCNINNGLTIWYKNTGGSRGDLESTLYKYTPTQSRLLPTKIKFYGTSNAIFMHPLKLSSNKANNVEVRTVGNPYAYVKRYGLNVLPNGNQLTINSTYSPIFLYRHHVLDGIDLQSVEARLSRDGFYLWDIVGIIYTKTALNVTKGQP